MNPLPRPARSASNQEVRQGSCEWRQPFVGCREASSSLVARSKTPSCWMGFSFLKMHRSAGEPAASTCAERVKSRGEAGFLRMATAIRGMPGSEFEPRRPFRKKKDTQGCLLVRQQNQNFWNRLSICTGHTSYPFFLS